MLVARTATRRGRRRGGRGDGRAARSTAEPVESARGSARRTACVARTVDDDVGRPSRHSTCWSRRSCSLGRHRVSHTVLICDDAIFMRTMVGDILQQAGFEIVGEAETGVQAVEKYKQLRPDLVTMDIVMPDMGGIDAVREICKFDPKARDPHVQRHGPAGARRRGDPGGREGLRRQAVPAEPRARSRAARARVTAARSTLSPWITPSTRSSFSPRAASTSRPSTLRCSRSSADGGAARRGCRRDLRAVHTIKGMSATMGYATVAELVARAGDAARSRAPRRARASTRALMDLLFRAADVLERAIEAAVARTRPMSQSTWRCAERARRLRDAAVRASRAEAAASPARGAHGGAVGLDGAGAGGRRAAGARSPRAGHAAQGRARVPRRAGARASSARSTPCQPPLERLQADEFDHDFAFALVAPTRRRTMSSAALRARRRRRRGARRRGRGAGPRRRRARRRAAVETRADRRRPQRTATERAAGRHARAAQRPHRPAPARQADEPHRRAGDHARPARAARRRRSTIRRSTETVAQASRLVADLQDEIMTSRMVPVWQVFDRFPRLVRDAARSVGQAGGVRDRGQGGRARSLDARRGRRPDRAPAAQRDRSRHRDARRTRVAQGKPAAGRLTLSAARDRSAVAIRVSDDGRGIDRATRARRARRSDGLVDATQDRADRRGAVPAHRAAGLLDGGAR